MGAKSGHHVFCVGASFHAKAAPHITHNDADFVFVEANQIGNSIAHARGHLAAHADGQPAVVWVGQNASRFNGKRSHTLVDDVQMDHMGRLIKRPLGGGGIAVSSFSHDVVWGVCEKRCIGCQSVAQLGGAGQGFKVNLQGLSSIPSLHFCVGHHCGNGLTHKTHRVCGQRIAGGR